MNRIARVWSSIGLSAALLVGGGILSAQPASADFKSWFSAQAHVAGLGWIPTSSAYVGTVGQGRAIEALKFTQNSASYTICGRAHMRDLGWGPVACTQGKGKTMTIGTTGQGRPIEAIEIWSPNNKLIARAHVQSIGWMGTQWSADSSWPITVGTTGRSKSLEAIEFF